MDPLAGLSVASLAISLFLLSSVAYFTITYLFRLNAEKGLLPLPPAPPGRPLIGNLTDVLAATKAGELHLLFEKWARQYGDVYRVNLGLFDEYMINSDLAVKQVLDVPAGISANRPPWLVSRTHICNDWNVLLLDGDDPIWKHQRKVTWSNIGSIPRADAALPFLHFETLQFLHEVAHDVATQQSGPALWSAMLRYTYSLFATQMFGLHVPRSTDPAIEYIHETGLAQMLGTLPGYYMVEVLPFLDRLPMALKPWERRGRARFRRDLEWCVERLNRMKNMKDRSAIRESLMCKMIEDDNNLGFTCEEEGAYLCLMLTLGGADTTVISTWSFLEAMLEFPHVQAKAQQQLDQVVGDCIPTWEDYDQIPYVRPSPRSHLLPNTTNIPFILTDQMSPQRNLALAPARRPRPPAPDDRGHHLQRHAHPRRLPDPPERLGDPARSRPPRGSRRLPPRALRRRSDDGDAERQRERCAEEGSLCVWGGEEVRILFLTSSAPFHRTDSKRRRTTDLQQNLPGLQPRRALPSRSHHAHPLGLRRPPLGGRQTPAGHCRFPGRLPGDPGHEHAGHVGAKESA